MKYLSLTFLLVCSCYTVGKIDGTSEKPIEALLETPVAEPVAEPAEEPYVARLYLSSAQPAYSSDESIPVQIIIQTGTFNLLVSYATIEGEGLLPNLVVKDEQGKIIDPKRPIAHESEAKRLVRNGKKVNCIPGVELNAGTVRNVVVEDLQTHYELKPGIYTLQLLMDLDVYEETLALESLLIHDAQQRISRVQAKSKIAAHTRRKHIAGLQRSIEALQLQAEQLGEIYLPVDSVRGTAPLESNIFTLRIQGSS